MLHECLLVVLSVTLLAPSASSVCVIFAVPWCAGRGPFLQFFHSLLAGGPSLPVVSFLAFLRSSSLRLSTPPAPPSELKPDRVFFSDGSRPPPAAFSRACGAPLLSRQFLDKMALSKLSYISLACGSTSLLSYCFPSVLNSLLPQPTEASPNTLRVLSTLVNTSFSCLFGSSAWVFFVVSPMLKKYVSRWKNAELQLTQYQIFYCASTVLSATLLGTVCHMGMGHSRLHVAAAISVIGNVINSCIIMPQLQSLHDTRRALEEQLGIDEADSAEQAAEVARRATRGGDGDKAAAGAEYYDVVRAFKIQKSVGMAVGILSFSALFPFLVS